MIKVCHIANIITGKSDGVYKHLKMIFELSDKKKYEHFLIFQGNKKIESELKQIGIKTFVVESLNKKFSIGSFTEIFRLLKEVDPAIIHTHLVKPYAITGLLNIWFRKKFIFNYHGLFIHGHPYYNIFERLIYRIMHFLIYLFRIVDIVLVPSEKSKRLLKSQTKLFPEPIVYYNGYYSKENVIVNEDLISCFREFKSESIIIALIGRLEIEKRIDQAIKLISEVRIEGNNIHFLVFGDGTLKEKLQQLSVKLNADDIIKFYDFVPHIEAYFQYFDIILFTSEWEGMPLTLWEAMANKVPIIAPDVGGFGEILLENSCGLVYEPGNLKDAKEKLLKLTCDKSLRMSLGENGKAAINTKYNAKNFIKKIEEIYQRIL